MPVTPTPGASVATTPPTPSQALAAFGDAGDPWRVTEPVMRVVEVPWAEFDGTHDVPVVGRHRHGIDRVEFSLNGGAWTSATDRETHTGLGAGNHITDTFSARLDSSTLPTGWAVLRANAYPLTAGTPRQVPNHANPLEYRNNDPFDRGNDVDGNPIDENKLWLWNRNGVSLPVIVCGSGETYTTFDAALTAGEASYPGGGFAIECKAGTYSQGNVDWAALPDRWIEVRRHSSASAGSVVFEESTGQCGNLKLHFIGVAFDGGQVLNGDSASYLWVDGCTSTEGEYSVQSCFKGFDGGSFITETDITVRKLGGLGDFSRNVTLDGIGSEAAKGYYLLLNIVITGHHRVASGVHPDTAEEPHLRDVIVKDVTIDSTCETQGWNFGGSHDYENVLFEGLNSANQGNSMVFGSSVGAAFSLTNLLVWDCNITNGSQFYRASGAYANNDYDLHGYYNSYFSANDSNILPNWDSFTDDGTLEVIAADGEASSGGDVTAPTILSATVAADGVTWTLVPSESVGAGADGWDDFAPTMSGGALTLTKNPGVSLAPIYTGSRPVTSSETGTLAYTQPGDGVQDASGNLMATFSGLSVTNNSTQVTSAVPATLQSAALNDAGTQLTLVWSGGMDVDEVADIEIRTASETGVAAGSSVSSGDGTATVVITLDTTVLVSDDPYVYIAADALLEAGTSTGNTAIDNFPVTHNGTATSGSATGLTNPTASRSQDVDNGFPGITWVNAGADPTLFCYQIRVDTDDDQIHNVGLREWMPLRFLAAATNSKIAYTLEVRAVKSDGSATAWQSVSVKRPKDKWRTVGRPPVRPADLYVYASRPAQSFPTTRGVNAVEVADPTISTYWDDYVTWRTGSIYSAMGSLWWSPRVRGLYEHMEWGANYPGQLRLDAFQECLADGFTHWADMDNYAAAWGTDGGWQAANPGKLKFCYSGTTNGVGDFEDLVNAGDWSGFYTRWVASLAYVDHADIDETRLLQGFDQINGFNGRSMEARAVTLWSRTKGVPAYIEGLQKPDCMPHFAGLPGTNVTDGVPKHTTRASDARSPGRDANGVSTCVELSSQEPTNLGIVDGFVAASLRGNDYAANHHKIAMLHAIQADWIEAGTVYTHLEALGYDLSA